MAHPSVYFGEKTRIGCNTTEEIGTSFTATATVSIRKDGAASLIRDDVAATVATAATGRSGLDVYYVETFSAANGYEEDTQYIVTFKVSITCGGGTFVEKHEGNLRVLAVSDE